MGIVACVHLPAMLTALSVLTASFALQKCHHSLLVLWVCPSRGKLGIPVQSEAAWMEAQPEGTGELNQSWDGAPGLREKPGVPKDAIRASVSSGALIWGLGMKPSGKGGEADETVIRHNFQSLSDSWV